MSSRQRVSGTRPGGRAGAISAGLLDAIAAEEARLELVPEATDRVKAVGDVFAALDVGLHRIASVRKRAIVTMRREGMSQKDIARAVGLSRPRISQILRDPRFERPN